VTGRARGQVLQAAAAGTCHVLKRAAATSAPDEGGAPWARRRMSTRCGEA
jgi:hypothetical protein